MLTTENTPECDDFAWCGCERNQVVTDAERHVMLKGRLMVCPGNVTVTVHAPIETTTVAREGVRDLSKTVQARVVADVT